MNNNIKSVVFLLIFILLTLLLTFEIAAQSDSGIKPLGKIPTVSSCNCVVYKGFKQTTSTKGELTIKGGTATVYADAVVFTIGGKSITLIQMRPDIYIDSDKNDMWLARTDSEGDIIFQNKKTIYYYSPKGKIK